MRIVRIEMNEENYRMLRRLRKEEKISTVKLIVEGIKCLQKKVEKGEGVNG